MKVFVVLPTYNEVENIEAMLIELKKAGDGIEHHEIHVLVVDDNSPDGTQEVVKRIMQEQPHVHLITGQKNGLGAAYIRGMKEALRLGAEVVFEMDADFSHDPKDLKRFLREVDDGFQFVIGSRYVAGGSIPDEWKAWRKLNSVVGNFVARLVAGIYTVKDCTGGFRAISADLLRKIDLDNIKTQGYGFQVTLLYEAYSRKALIKEIPIVFKDRAFGESKLGLRDIFEFIANAFGIRLRGSKTLIKFLLVGVSGVVVNLGVFAWLMTIPLNEFVASPLAIEASIIWNFFLNNVWTFRSRNTERGLVLKGLYFNIVSVLSLAISYSTFVALALVWPEGPLLVFQSIGILPASFVNYFFNSYWTFKDKATST